MTPRFTISIVTYTALPQAKACIASVLRSTLPFTLILTANGNAEAAQYFISLRREFPFIVVVTTSKNTGFISPNRFAFSMCKTDFFILLNDDAIVPPDWLELLVEPFDRDEKMAIVGQDNACCSLRDNFFGFKGPRYEYVEFSAAMVRTSIMRELGLFSDYIEWSSTEDSDASLRAREAGYHITKADFSIIHEVGATRKHVPGLAEIFQRNLSTCQKRWADYLKSKDRKFPCER
jgi:GT2 family glycosyltransferase